MFETGGGGKYPPFALRRKRRRRRRLIILQKKVPGLTEGALERFVVRAKKKVGLRGAVSVLVTSSREMRDLNSRFRGKNKATDVLSFPALPGVVTRFAGDVAISADIAAANAKQLGHSPAEEVKVLALHGVLHLRGYDHERDRGEMARKEQSLRKELNLPTSLTERDGEVLVRSARLWSEVGKKRRSR